MKSHRYEPSLPSIQNFGVRHLSFIEEQFHQVPVRVNQNQDILVIKFIQIYDDYANKLDICNNSLGINLNERIIKVTSPLFTVQPKFEVVIGM
jgi:hypothetical protein